MMLANEYGVPLQLASSRIVSTMPISNYFETCDSYSGKSDFENLLEPMTTTVMASDLQNLDSNSSDSYSVHDQNFDVNLAFRMSPLTSMPPPIHNVYVNNFNNNNIILKNCNNQKRGNWKNYTNKPQGYDKTDNKSFSSRDKLIPDNHSAKHKIPRNGSRNPYEHTTVYNNYRFNDYTNVFANSIPLTQHNTNNFNSDRYVPNNGKRPRHQREYKRVFSEEIVRRVHGLMERFSSKAALFQIKPVPYSYNNRQLTKLDMAVWNLYINKAQTKNTYFNKLELWKQVYLHITKLFDRYGLFMVGSTMSGLGTETSDIDMCLLMRTVSCDPRSDAVRCLEMIKNSLLSCDYIASSEVILAKVPILKFKSVKHGFEVDLNCNNSVGIRNTHLLHCYAQLDWRVRPMIIVVKLWAQANGINDAKNMTISSYSLALMVIHFLQCGVTPPVIPCLHGLYPDKFNPEKEIHDIDIQEELPKFYSDNKQALGELLLGFLQYYTYFNYETYAISVRLASRVLIDECRYARSQKNDPHQWKYLCIEEPFDFTNTARSVYDLVTFKRIQHIFQVSSRILRETENLPSILTNLEESQR